MAKLLMLIMLGVVGQASAPPPLKNSNERPRPAARPKQAASSETRRPKAVGYMASVHRATATEALAELAVGARLVRITSPALRAAATLVEVNGNGTLSTAAHALRYATATELRQGAQAPFRGELIVPDFSQQRLVRQDGREFQSIENPSMGPLAEARRLTGESQWVVLVRQDPEVPSRHYVRHVFREVDAKLIVDDNALPVESVLLEASKRVQRPPEDGKVLPMTEDPYDPPVQSEPAQLRRP